MPMKTGDIVTYWKEIFFIIAFFFAKIRLNAEQKKSDNFFLN